MQRECAALLNQVQSALPSIVLSLLDANGNAVADAKVKIDGVPVRARQAGRAVVVNPGVHNVAFLTGDGQKVERSVTVLEGVSGQRVVARIGDSSSTDATSAEGDAEAAKSQGTEKQRPSDAKSAGASRSGSVMPYLFGGVAVLGVGGFVTLGALRNSAEQDLRACFPNCSRDRVDHVRDLALMANVSLGIGVTAAAASLVMLVLDGGRGERASALRSPRARYALDVRRSSTDTFLELRGAF